MRERHRTIGSAVAAAVLVLALGACGDDEDAASATEPVSTEGISVTDAWSRQPAEGQTVTAVYGIVSNPTDEDVTIVSASSPVTDRVELHEPIENADGTMKMQEKDSGFVVPAGGEFAFESGGPHVMLFDIDPATYPATIDVTLTFDSGDPIVFAAEVRELAGDGMDMGSEMSSGEASGAHTDEPAVDGTALHELEEELAAGTLEADRQRMVVAEAIGVLEDETPADGSPEAELLTILHDLDTAIVAGDVEAATAAAAAAHEAAHELEEHDDE